MRLEPIREFMDKFPVTLLMLGYLGWIGYDYYAFTTDPSSPLISKRQEIKTAQSEVEALQGKIKQINEFAASLDARRVELRNLAQDLEATKATLTEDFDMPETMKSLLVEARRSGIKVTSLKPLEYKKGDFYGEQLFEFDSTGVYFQYVTFLDHVANLQRIIKVSSFSFMPASASMSKYVELKANIKFATYKYLGSQADEVAKNPGAARPKPSGPGT